MRHWDIDRLAATELAAVLQIAPDDNLLDVIAGQFARHRTTSMEWAAKRAREQVVAMLESEELNRIGRKNEAWGEGVAFAEQRVAAMSVSDLLGELPGKARSFGQVLRSMKRNSRQRPLD